MKVETTTIPKKYEDAVAHWVKHNFPDMPLLDKYWDKYFPSDDRFCLCAKMDLNTSKTIEVGDQKGGTRAEDPSQLSEEAAKHLLAIIRAQASTEFGSIQQHQVTLDRSPSDQDKFWVLRVMAEELRHGYQMFHMLTSRNWEPLAGVKTEDMVEDVLAMETGSHVLEAFNLPYDSFVDNVVFAAIIDRVGKYQLTMQKVCAYRPFAQSMTPMLREEAFHLASGVVPMRRWLESAAKGNPLITSEQIQRSINKWVPRALEMFGDERGGEKNMKLGFKDMKNREAQDRYIEEITKLVRDLNQRFLRARYPNKSPQDIDALYDQLVRDRGSAEGTRHDELLYVPHREFFRRRGEPAFRMVGVDGRTFTDAEAFIRHLADALPQAYLASKDMADYSDLIRRVAAGEVTIEQASKKSPVMKRKESICPCSKSVRWVDANGVEKRPAAATGEGSPTSPSPGNASRPA
ncbi:MAG: Phenylacetic acid catabolic protein [Candidatus Eiseniibacteriota bacterium]